MCQTCDKEIGVVSEIHGPNVVFKILKHVELLDSDQTWEAGGRGPLAQTG